MDHYDLENRTPVRRWHCCVQRYELIGLSPATSISFRFRLRTYGSNASGSLKMCGRSSRYFRLSLNVYPQKDKNFSHYLCTVLRAAGMQHDVVESDKPRRHLAPLSASQPYATAQRMPTCLEQ